MTLIVNFQKRISDLSHHHTTLADELLNENKRVQKEKQRAIDEANMKSAEAVSKVRQTSVVQASRLKERLKQKDRLIEELQDMAETVADEYFHCKTKAEVSAAKEDAMRETANIRLMKFKNLQERNADLKTIIETDRELMQEQVSTLLAKNHLLKEQLEMKTMELEAANHDLNEACEEIHVSEICDKFT